MQALANAAGASVCALFVPRPTGLILACQNDLDQKTLDITHSAWARKREVLEAGHPVRFGVALVCPLFDGPNLVGIAYFNPADESFPNEESRADAALVAARLSTWQGQAGRSSYLTAGLSQSDRVMELMRDEVAIALNEAAGNVSSAARRLGLTRQGLYHRAGILGIDLTTFRARFRGKKK
jgi:hypothetical protein